MRNPTSQWGSVVGIREQIAFSLYLALLVKL
jgi:hypothetical protein